jgi:hypothetical protein
MPVQMAFTGVPNEVFACNPFITSVPPAVNQGVSAHFPDTVGIPEMRWNTHTCNLSTARLRVTLTDPLTRHRRQA